MAASLAAPAVPAQSAAGSPPQPQVVYLAPLLINADGDAAARDPYARPSAVSSIGAERIDLLGSQNLDDALRTLPGTFTRDNVQNPGIAVNIRGLEGSGRVNMSVDGIRQNFRFTGHDAQGLVYVDPALLAGIEVERGVVAGAGGAGALTGRANFRTLGVDDVLRQGQDFGGFVRLGDGNNETGYTQVLAAGLRLHDWAFAAAISDREPDDYHNGHGQSVADTHQDLHSDLFKLRYQPNDRHRLDFGTVRYDNTFTANSYPQDVDSKQYSGNYAYTPGGAAVDLRANVYRSQVTMHYGRSPSLRGGGEAAGRRLEDRGTGLDLSNTSRLGERLDSNYGVEYFHDDVDVINSTALPDSGVNGPGESSIASVFSDTHLQLGPVDLGAALRYDRFTLKGHGAVAANNPVQLPAGAYHVDRDAGSFNPKLSLAVDVTDWLQPYLNWGKSQRAPTVAETFAGGIHPSVGQMRNFYPNPFLQPEKLRGPEVGFNLVADRLFSADDMLQLKVDYFHHRIDNYVTAINHVDVSARRPRFDSWFANVAGQSTIKGYEVEGEYDAGFVFANLSYSDTQSDLPTQIDGYGAHSYLPDSVASATLGARFLERRLTVGSRWFHTTRSFVGQVNADTFGVAPWDPGYSLVDVFANYRFDNGTELRLNVANVGDRAYTPILSGIPTLAGYCDRTGACEDTGPGRTATLSATFRF